jgi:hypothetical protein
MRRDGARQVAILKAIVAITIVVDTVEAQKQLVQHKGDVEQRGAMAVYAQMAIAAPWPLRI